MYHIGKIQSQVLRRIRRLNLVLDGAPAIFEEQDRRVSFVTIEAVNAWGIFCRFFYLSCALGGKDANGSRIVSGGGSFQTTQDALTLAVHEVKPRLRSKTGPWTYRDEPTWHQIDEFTRVMRALNPSNLSNVLKAVSLTTNVFQDLPTFRNFFAHRGEHTARKARSVANSYLVSTQLHPTSILVSYQPGRPQTILRDWLDDLRIVVELMA